MPTTKPLREWTEADLVSLVQSGRVEGPMLEYKAALCDTNDRGNREFLLDVCSLANSNGGDIVVGISEQRDENGPTGAPNPEAALGIECDNPEQVLASLENRILDSIDERLLIESHAVDLGGRRKALVFRVPNSVDKPHRVAYQGKISFPARRERQRYELNATEIKDMVMRTSSKLDSAETEIMHSLSKRVASQGGPTLTVTIVPVFTRNFAFDFRRREVIDAFGRIDLTGLGRLGFTEPRFSVEGLTRRGFGNGVNVILGHNGLLRLTVLMQGTTMGEIRSFHPLTPDLYIRGLARGCGAIYETAGLTAPALLGAAIDVPSPSVTNYGDARFDDGYRVYPFSKVYPSVLLEHFDAEVDARVRPLCDLIHLSFGEARSHAFNSDGAWIYQSRL